MDNKVFASFWLRALAHVLNALVLSIDAFVLMYLVVSFLSYDVFVFINSLLWFLLFAIFVRPFIWFLLWPVLISEYGGDVGKLICGLKIVHEDGSNLTFKRAMFREYIAKMAAGALFGIGYYWIFKTEKKQGWHDMLSDTYVVKEKSGRLFVSLVALVVVLVLNAGLAVLSVTSYLGNESLKRDVTSILEEIGKSSSPDTSNKVYEPLDLKPLPTPPTFY